MTCTICRGAEPRSHALEAGEWTLVVCARCGYAVVDPLPDEATLDRLYAADHFHSSYHPEAARDAKLLAQREVQYDQDRALLLEFVAEGRLLDYGCGNGRFLAGFPLGFEKLGYERNRTTTAWLEENAPFRLLRQEDDVRALEPGSLHAVTMRGVIEHLREPERVLATLSEKLRPGGVLFVCATPNVDSPCALVFGERWNQFTPPYHLHFFSPRTLAVLGARHGLALIECRFPYLGTPYEQESADSVAFLEAVARSSAGRAPEEASPPFPGTMMSLVFRRLESPSTAPRRRA